MRSWTGYALAGLVLILLGAVVAGALVAPAARPGVWFAAAVAYVVQLGAFGALLALRAEPNRFMLGWVGGIMLRFGVVAVIAFWLQRNRLLALNPTLISLVAFVVLLLFLELFFLRPRGARRAMSAGRDRGNEGAD